MSEILRLVEVIDGDDMENVAGPLVNRVEWHKIKEWIRNVEKDREASNATLADGSGLYTVEDGWIETYTGKQFFFKRPTPEMIDLDDIAPALSKICRYAGHTKAFYSVAEHCVLMSDWVLQWTGSGDLAMSALLHDAAEPYLCDLPRPIKVCIPQFKALEEKIDRAICEKFRLPYPFPQLIKELDARILNDERRLVMNPSANDWGTDGLEPLCLKEIYMWDPSEAELNFRGAFEEIVNHPTFTLHTSI